MIYSCMSLGNSSFGLGCEFIIQSPVPYLLHIIICVPKVLVVSDVWVATKLDFNKLMLIVLVDLADLLLVNLFLADHSEVKENVMFVVASNMWTAFLSLEKVTCTGNTVHFHSSHQFQLLVPKLQSSALIQIPHKLPAQLVLQVFSTITNYSFISFKKTIISNK